MTTYLTTLAIVLGGDANVGRELTWQESGPGLYGFVTMFCLAAATIGLMFAMTRQMRRINHAIRKADLEAAEQATSQADAAADSGKS